MIRFSGITKSHTRAHTGESETILRDFSLDVHPGELVAIVGPSGIGKTTLLHLAAGLDKPDRGHIQVGDGAPRIGMVFQQPRLFDWLSVAENIGMATDAAGIERAAGKRMLASVELARYAAAYPLALSGGQRQRVALARAFAIQPSVVLLDEPFSALDELTARRLRGLLQDLWLEHEPTGLLVTHNTLEAAFLADRIVVLGGRPARIEKIIEIGRTRPRAPEDPLFFEIHAEIIARLAEAHEAA